MRMLKERVEQIETDARSRIARELPDVDLLACEPLGPERLRLVIDSTDGVDLELCEKVTSLFPDLLEEFSLEVSSPGPERPLRTPEHFSERTGERVRVRTNEPVAGSRNLIGKLLSCERDCLVLETEQGDQVRIDLEVIARANLAPSTEQGIQDSDQSNTTESEVNA
jgi:ribosome maturation factor RimP